jgi:hypothetical protein
MKPRVPIVNSPNPDSSQGLTGNGLQVVASPLNGGSDLWNGLNHDAPIVIQKIPPATDWQITVQFVFDPDEN